MKKLTLDQMRRALADKGVKGYADGNSVDSKSNKPAVRNFTGTDEDYRNAYELSRPAPDYGPPPPVTASPIANLGPGMYYSLQEPSPNLSQSEYLKALAKDPEFIKFKQTNPRAAAEFENMNPAVENRTFNPAKPFEPFYTNEKISPDQQFDVATQTFFTPRKNWAGTKVDEYGRAGQEKQLDNLYDQLNAIDAWNTAGATREGAEAPWLMNPASRMMAVGIKDDYNTSGPAVILHDPSKGRYIPAAMTHSWFVRGDPAASYEQAKNVLPYEQAAAILGITNPFPSAKEDKQIWDYVEKKGLPPLPFMEYNRGTFLPSAYGLSDLVARRREAELTRKIKPLDLMKEYLNLTPYQGPKPTIYQFPELTGYAEGGIASLAGGGGMPNIIGQKTAAAPYQVYDKASDTYRYVDAAEYEKWLSGIPLTPINTVPGSPVYYGAPSKAEGDYDIGGGGLSYIPEEPPPPPRYDIYGNQLQDDPYLKTLTEGETKDLESLGAFDPEARARLLEPLKNSLMPENAAGFLDVQQMLRNMYNDPEQRKVFDQYVDDLKYAPYDAREWFQKKIELDKRSEEEGFAPDREYMPITGSELSQVNRENTYLPRNIANEMQRLVNPNTPNTVVKNFGDVKGNLAEDYVVTDRGQAIEPNSGSTVDKLYGGTPLSEMEEREGLEQGGGGASGGSVRKFRYAGGAVNASDDPMVLYAQRVSRPGVGATELDVAAHEANLLRDYNVNPRSRAAYTPEGRQLEFTGKYQTSGDPIFSKDGRVPANMPSVSQRPVYRNALPTQQLFNLLALDSGDDGMIRGSKDGGSISEEVNHVPQKGVPSIGINVATDKDMRYADLIVDGKKRYESRNSDSLRPWVGKRVSIVRTGEGKAKAIGAATLGEPLVVDAAKFRSMQEQHLVPPGSKFDIKAGTKYLYPVNNPERFEKEHDVGHGIVARRVTQTMAEGGAPKKTVTAYKMFRVDPKHPGKLFPLFVNADKPVEMNKWIDAEEGSKSKTGKVKSKLGDLAYRPGWHSGDVPIATHIGDKDDDQKAEIARLNALRKAEAQRLGNDKKAKAQAKQKHPYPDWVNAPKLRNPRHLWAEVSLPDDVNWQDEARKRGMNKQGKVIAKNAHITDQIPKGGNYRYKTNPNMTGNWLISGAMKVNRVLPDEEVERINKEAGVEDLPRKQPMDIKKFGFAKGGPTIDEMRYRLLKRKG